jgi:integrase
MKRRTGWVHKRGDNYYMSYKVDGRLITQRLSDGQGQPIKNKEDAEIRKDELMDGITKGDQVKVLENLINRLDATKGEVAKFQQEQNPALTIDKAWAEFVSSPNRPDSGDATMRQYEFQWKRFADWMKENHPMVTTLSGVTADTAAAYASHLNGDGCKFSANTINKHLNLLTLVFRVTKNKSRITDNPFEGIQRKRLVTHSRRELTVDELKKICTSATGELRTMLAVGVYSGLRLGDAATLRWAEVDLRRGIITRIPNKIARSSARPVTIPLHGTLRGMLAEIPAEQRGEFVLPEMAGLYENRSDLVTDKVQAHFRANGINVWKRGTGKEGKRAVIEVGYHSLRHSFVSLCRESDVPLVVVESLVGHSNPAMTRHYSHIGQLAAQRAVALLPSITGEEKDQAPKVSPESILTQARAIVASITDDNMSMKVEELKQLLS